MIASDRCKDGVVLSLPSAIGSRSIDSQDRASLPGGGVLVRGLSKPLQIASVGAERRSKCIEVPIDE